MTPTLTNCPEPWHLPWRAAEALNAILQHPSPAQAVARHGAEIELLIPTLLALNVQQAQHIGQVELARALTALLAHVQPQVQPSAHRSEADARAASPAPARLAFIGASPEIEAFPLEALRALGYGVATGSVGAGAGHEADLIVLHQPQAEPAAAQAALDSGRPILFYLDADYARMPPSHPDYARLGLTTPERISAYTTALARARIIAVPGQALAERLRESGHAVEVLWPAWRRQNPGWARPAPRRSALYLGWFAASGDGEALLALKRVLARLVRELSDVMVVLVGGATVFQELARALPEHRCLLLPPVAAADHPYALSQLDVLLLPWRDTPFYQVQSDQFLMEAGLRRLPWVASPLPAVADWQVGGLIAHDVDAWYAHLRQLCLQPALRAKLGEAGRQRAELREAAGLAADWQRLIHRILS